MVTLNAKLKDLEDEKLIGRVVEIWGFFWDQVLTYIEGVSCWPIHYLPLLLLMKPLIRHRSSFHSKQTPFFPPSIVLPNLTAPHHQLDKIRMHLP